MRWLSDDGECAIVRELKPPLHSADHLASRSFEVVSTTEHFLKVSLGSNPQAWEEELR